MGRVRPQLRKSQTFAISDCERDPRLQQGLARGLAVLRAFKPGERSLGNAEISDRTDLPRPTVSRLTQTLATLGYLTYQAQGGRYSLGPGVVALCHALLAEMPFRLAAKPIIQRVADRHGLPVSIGTRDQTEILYLDTARRAGTAPVRFEIGARLPLETTAIGRAYLFALPEEERVVVLDCLRKDKPDLNWPDIEAGLVQSFQSLASVGFCISSAWRDDVIGLGAPVTTRDGAVFAINCGGRPGLVVPCLLMGEVANDLLEAASELSSLSFQ